jgi:hypothetical protein
MAEDDQDREKKVSELTLPEVKDQLQILEYIELNKPEHWTEGNRRLRHELEFREQQLIHDRRLDPKLEDLEKSLADRQAQQSHDLALAQTAELNRLGPSQELTDRHRQEWEQQAKDFAKERDRYIEEFHEAKRLLDRMRGEEEERGLGRDETKGLSH